MAILRKKPGWTALAALFGAALIVMIVIGVWQLIRADPETIPVSASGRQSLEFRVFYVDNDFFGCNPVLSVRSFLMSYTDFIEVDSGFSADFGREMDLHYTYTAKKRLVIRQMGGDVVFEKVLPLSEASGRAAADRLRFGPETAGPGGTHRIVLHDHIRTYLDFSADHARRMAEAGIFAQAFRGFTADLMIDFTYTIRAPEYGINESTTYGYRIPLTSELFTFTPAGVSYFNWERDIADVIAHANVSLPMIIVFVAVFAVSVGGLMHSIREIMADPNKKRGEVDAIFKKYSQEIVVYDRPVDMKSYTPMFVGDFGELLKLAVSLNKHIMCYRGPDRIDFVVIVDDHAAVFAISL